MDGTAMSNKLLAKGGLVPICSEREFASAQSTNKNDYGFVRW